MRKNTQICESYRDRSGIRAVKTHVEDQIQVNRQLRSMPLTSGSLIEVDVDALQLEIRVSVVGAGGVDSVLI